VSATTEELERVREYRRATRFAIEAEATVQARCLALLDLAEAARAEADPLVRTWGERCIWEESKRFLGVDDEEHEFPPTAFEQRVRTLRAEGYSRCPKCWHDLPNEADFERWGRMRAGHIAELRRREEAVDG
jgi:hypothetical protein